MKLSRPSGVSSLGVALFLGVFVLSLLLHFAQISSRQVGAITATLPPPTCPTGNVPILGGSGCGTPTPTNTPPPTSTLNGDINGTVYESFSGFMRGATVTLSPLGWQTETSVSDGSYAFVDVPNGDYTLSITNPSCTPFGCYKATPVTVNAGKVTVDIFPNPPTPTPPPNGDVSCDGATSPVDALLILQLEIALITSLDCPSQGDVNGDGSTDSLDALLILKYVVGLVSTLS